MQIYAVALYKNTSHHTPQPLRSLSLWLTSSISIYFSAFKKLYIFYRSRTLYAGLHTAKCNCKILLNRTEDLVKTNPKLTKHCFTEISLCPSSSNYLFCPSLYAI